MASRKSVLKRQITTTRKKIEKLTDKAFKAANNREYTLSKALEINPEIKKEYDTAFSKMKELEYESINSNYAYRNDFTHQLKWYR